MYHHYKNVKSGGIPSVGLSNGREMPVVGLGTWMGADSGFSNDVVRLGVEAAIDAGYRHIDTAWMYRTEEAIGQAVGNKVKTGAVKREELFITSKLWMTHHAAEDTHEYFMDSLTSMGLDYIDLFLIHHPFSLKKVEGPYNPLTYDGTCELDKDRDIMETWRALEDLVDSGKIKSIGVSNFNANQVKYVLDNCCIPPVVNQCEVHMYLQNTELFEYCKEAGVIMTCYSPLGNPPQAIAPDWKHPWSDPGVVEISKKYNKTPAQVLLKYQLQRGLTVVPKTLNIERMSENIQLFDFDLTQEEMGTLKQLDQGKRIFTWPQGIGHKDYPF